MSADLAPRVKWHLAQLVLIEGTLTEVLESERTNEPAKDEATDALQALRNLRSDLRNLARLV